MFDLTKIQFLRSVDPKTHEVVVHGHASLTCQLRYAPSEMVKNGVLDCDHAAQVALAQTFWRVFYNELVAPVLRTKEALDQLDPSGRMSALFINEFSVVMSPNFEKVEYQPIQDKPTLNNRLHETK